jgi:hypothetical protein
MTISEEPIRTIEVRIKASRIRMLSDLLETGLMSSDLEGMKLKADHALKGPGPGISKIALLH